MKEFKDKVAVITGGASGIGLAIAERCIKEDMKVILADVEIKALLEVEQAMRASGAEVSAVQTNVSSHDEINFLAQAAVDTYGGVHLLFNNAGIGGSDQPICSTSVADWKWVIDVNLMGVVYGIQTFVPIMLDQNTDCHIVNTASLAGLLNYASTGAYNVTKHGVVSLSETLHHELMLQSSKIKVSVLCPGSVNTRIMESERNRPVELSDDGTGGETSESKTAEDLALEADWKKSIESGLSPEQVADCVFNAIINEQFYILTHPEEKVQIRQRLEDILQDRVPTEPHL